MCSGDCAWSWTEDRCLLPVSCGSHTAPSCGECSQAAAVPGYMSMIYPHILLIQTIFFITIDVKNSFCNISIGANPLIFVSKKMTLRTYISYSFSPFKLPNKESYCRCPRVQVVGAGVTAPWLGVWRGRGSAGWSAWQWLGVSCWPPCPPGGQSTASHSTSSFTPTTAPASSRGGGLSCCASPRHRGTVVVSETDCRDSGRTRLQALSMFLHSWVSLVTGTKIFRSRQKDATHWNWCNIRKMPR